MPVVNPTVDPSVYLFAEEGVPISEIDTAPAPLSDFVTIQNADSGLWDVVNPKTGQAVASNLPDQAVAQETADLQQSLVSSPSVSASSVDNAPAPIPT